MITLRDQTDADAAALHALVAEAFSGNPHSRGTEPFILEALWRGGAATVALVAEEGGDLVGQVAASPAAVAGGAGWHGLGPIAVRPDRQRRGIGSALMVRAIAELRAIGSAGCVLVGDPGFYQRFGFAAVPGLDVAGVPPCYVLALPFGAAVPVGEALFHPAFAATSTGG